ncbi:MAG TPA: Gfo/Idh/MocA family oxidoreductase [Kiritimatiellia bacterium]|jgi:hypothetical protein|nr:MAG: Glycosyl hydrolase family 109 protein 1 precursor [Verrucomicrobia bacterium ADurb.Bin070]HQA38405.1 Gfo/Idh/MocA family oxidoreductase [Kiritimatiellia bacterium]HQQ92640.1 Gfo/Idh/MocA family oxidoreductase [Kiritimatiellia bacterium]
MSEKLGRRGFIKQAAWMGAALAAAGKTAGCRTLGRGEAAMAVTGLVCPPMETVRVGVIGLGARGPGAVHIYAGLPGIQVTALCDLYKERAENQQKWLKEKGKPDAAVYGGSEEAWKKLCESDKVDLVHVTTPWLLHAPMALYAMRRGKHVAIEVPAAVTVDECWDMVETAEKTRRHCMMLENCCYGESEMFAFMLCRMGVLGDLIHGEGAYLHDLASYKFNKNGYQGMWRLNFSKQHTGNPYPMHGMGPICQYMDINRGDTFDFLTSVSSDQRGLSQFAVDKFGKESAEAKETYRLGDMNTTLIRTRRGRTIMVQHNTTNPRPYSRINTITGTKGTLADYPLRVALGDKAHGWMSDAELAALKAKYVHPLWDKKGEAARKSGGHGGMDYLLLLRLGYCLNKGLPLDISVYDTALWSSVVELSERSVLKRGASVDVPDFTRGGWKRAAPLGIVDVG